MSPRRLLRVSRADGSALEVELVGDDVEISEATGPLRHAVRIKRCEIESVVEALSRNTPALQEAD